MSSLETLRRYFAERLRLRLTIPLAAVLTAAGSAGATTLTASALGTACLFVFLLIAVHRLWDDLEDRERDRREHPERVLAGIRDPRPFHRALVALFVACALVLPGARPLLTMATIGLLDVALFAWYRWLRPRFPSPALHAHVVLLKYPVFALAAGDLACATTWPRGPLTLLVVYLGLTVFEAIDDRKTRVPALVAVELLTTVIVSGVALLHFGGQP